MLFRGLCPALGDVITMDHCSFYDAGMQYALNGNTVALVVRDVYSTFGSVYLAPSKNMEETTLALLHWRLDHS